MVLGKQDSPERWEREGRGAEGLGGSEALPCVPSAFPEAVRGVTVQVGAQKAFPNKGSSEAWPTLPQSLPKGQLQKP